VGFWWWFWGGVWGGFGFWVFLVVLGFLLVVLFGAPWGTSGGIAKGSRNNKKGAKGGEGEGGCDNAHPRVVAKNLTKTAD